MVGMNPSWIMRSPASRLQAPGVSARHGRLISFFGGFSDLRNKICTHLFLLSWLLQGVQLSSMG